MLKTGTHEIRTLRLERWDSDPGIEAGWDELLNRSPTGSIFQSHAWNACWWRAFGAPHELLLIVAHAGSELVGVAPMMIERKRTPLGTQRRSVCFIASRNGADYCDFVTDPSVPGALDALLDSVRIHSAHCDRIDLSRFPTHSPHQPQVLEYFQARRIRVTCERDAEAPVRIMGDTQADLQVANKQRLNRHTKFFRKSGDLRFLPCQSEAEALGYLDPFFEQHRQRREYVGSTSKFQDPVQRAFYRDLVHRMSAKGWLRFDVVLFNGAPIAFHFGFQYRNRLIFYTPTFDVRFASRSPGDVLIKFLLEDAVRQRLEEFDFAVGAEPYKYRFANRVRSNSRLIAYFSVADFLMHIFGGMLKPLRGRLKSSTPRTAATDAAAIEPQ